MPTVTTELCPASSRLVKLPALPSMVPTVLELTHFLTWLYSVVPLLRQQRNYSLLVKPKETSQRMLVKSRSHTWTPSATALVSLRPPRLEPVCKRLCRGTPLFSVVRTTLRRVAESCMNSQLKLKILVSLTEVTFGTQTWLRLSSWTT